MRDLLTMQERLESLFGRATPGWVPPVDLSETPDRYRPDGRAAGLDREDVQIDFHDDTAHHARRSGPVRACCPERYQQLERGQGQFSRSFRFAAPVDPDGDHRRPRRRRAHVTLPKAARRTEQSRSVDPSSNEMLEVAAGIGYSSAGLRRRRGRSGRMRSRRTSTDGAARDRLARHAADATSRPCRSGAVPALPDLTAVAERAVQASVNISSTQMVRVNDPFFQMF